MSMTFTTQRRMSVDVRASHTTTSRAPCSPITNEAPVIRKKPSFSLASLMPKRPSSRSSNHTSSADSTSSKPKKAKKPVIDLAATYGAEFARAVAANQFLNGGSLDDAIARVQRDNEKMARRRAEKMGVPYIPDAGAVIRGPNGELFRDTQEESERRGLVRNAYKGMPEPSHKSQSKGMRPEDHYATADDNVAPWAHFTASSAVSHAAQQRSSNVANHRDSARRDFFAASFAPVPVRNV